jgi:hypothetical protein
VALATGLVVASARRLRWTLAGLAAGTAVLLVLTFGPGA